jgi:hypothetical protein
VSANAIEQRLKRPVWANNLFYDCIRPLWQALGLGWANYQVMRRTAITLLNSTGQADPTIIAAMLGHTVDVSLNTYNKVGIERQRHAVKTLDHTLQRQPMNTTKPAFLIQEQSAN